MGNCQLKIWPNTLWRLNWLMKVTKVSEQLDKMKKDIEVCLAEELKESTLHLEFCLWYISTEELMWQTYPLFKIQNVISTATTDPQKILTQFCLHFTHQNTPNSTAKQDSKPKRIGSLKPRRRQLDKGHIHKEYRTNHEETSNNPWDIEDR